MLITDIFLHTFTFHSLPSVIKIEQFKTDNVSFLIKLKRKIINIKTQHDDFIEMTEKKPNLMTFTIGKKKKIQWKYIVLDFDFTKLN